MIFGALNTQSGTRLFLERKKQRQGDFQEFLGLIHERYRGWQVSLVLDGDSSHIAKMSRRMARILGIGLVWLPVRCPDLNCAGSPLAPWEGASVCQSAVRID